MKINLSKFAGFCPGVRRADETVRERIKNAREGERIYTLGHLIHNRIYNEELEKIGVSSIDFDDVETTYRSAPEKPMTVIIRTHGVTKDKSDFLHRLDSENGNFTVIDATCPFVKKIHKIAEENTNDYTYFLLFCDPGHPEAIGTMSYARGQSLAFSSLEELMAYDLGNKLPILCAQTTQNLVEFKKIKKFLKNLCTNAKIFDTICSVTENRQNEATKIAKESDLMIVIGGRESSNTHKLYDLCSLECPTIWIESYMYTSRK